MSTPPAPADTPLKKLLREHHELNERMLNILDEVGGHGEACEALMGSAEAK